MFEVGTVKFFDSRDNKRFGFLRLESEEEIFFHFNDGMSMRAGKDRPEWCDPPRGKRLWDPKANDVLVFERKMGRKGPKASPWTHELLYERALKVLVSRPRYRVVQQITPRGEAPSGPKILWEGTDLEDPALRRVWDPVHDRPSFSHDDFTIRRWFEELVQDTWVKCDDPR